MDPQQLGDLLKNKGINRPNQELRDLLVSSIRRTTGETITIENITIRGSIAYINAESILKSEIFLHKEGILKNLKEKIKIPHSFDIR